MYVVRTSSIEPKLEDVVNLLLVAEEGGIRVYQIVWYLLGRDPATCPLFVELQHMAIDAEIRVGSRHWALSTFELHR